MDRRYIVGLSVLLGTVLMLITMPSWSFALPDGRVYELVSPADKDGGIGGVLPLGSDSFSINQFGLPLQSSLDGNKVSYVGEDFYQASYGDIDMYLSQRGLAGWTTRNLQPFVPGLTNGAKYAGFSPDLSAGIVSSSFPLAEGVPVGYANLYLAQGAGLQALLMSKPTHRTISRFGYAFMRGPGEPGIEPRLLFAGANTGTAAAAAYSHILFEANDALTSNAKDGGEYEDNLYEWADGELRLVNVLPGTMANPTGEAIPDASFGVNHNDDYNNTPLPSLSHVISADGSRILWTDENDGDLYVREDGERTTLIATGGEFQTASADGSRVFFIKGEHLYEYGVDGDTTSDLAPDGGVLGLVGTSEDGAYVYFVATGALPGSGATEGQPNLYLSHGGQLSFIATLSLADDETPDLYGTNTREGDWFRTFAGRTAEVSPDGQYLAFLAKEKLTGYENLDANGHRHDYEIFLYDAVTGALACPSCNVNGSPPTANTLLPAPVNGVYQQRYLNDDGRLFFSTEDPVLPEDTNGVSDVYEYEGGHVYLISPGMASDEAVFADASESGNDVFFTTRQQLVPADGDQIVDLYDARVGGRPEESTPPPCSEEACHEQATGPPSIGAPVSMVFSGPGNETPLPVQPTVAGKTKSKTKKVPRKAGKKHRAKHGKRVKRKAGRAGKDTRG